MSVQVEKLENNMAKLTVTVPAKEFNAAMNVNAKTFLLPVEGSVAETIFPLLFSTKTLKSWSTMILL